MKDEWKFALPKWHENDIPETSRDPLCKIKSHVD